MSGPKCASYSVDRAALEAARRRNAALDHRASLLHRLERVEGLSAIRSRNDLEGVAVVVQAIDDKAETRDLEAWNRQAETAISRAERRLREMEDAERRAAVSARLRAAASDDEAAHIRRRAAEQEAAAERDTVDPAPVHNAFAVDVDELLSLIPAEATGEERRQVEHSIEQALRAEADDEARARVVGVKAQIQAIERVVADRRHDRARAEELLRSLDGLRSPDVDAARALLDRVARGETRLLRSDAERIQHARREAESAEQRAYVADQLAAALGDAGYDTDLGFATDMLTGEETYLPARDSEEHAVGVTLRDGLFDIRLVRATGAPDGQRDADAETEFCKDVGRISAELLDDGVTLELISHAPAGAEPVEVVHEAGSVLRRRRSSSRATRERRR